MRGLLVLVGVRWAAVVVSGGFSWTTREDEISKTGKKMSPVTLVVLRIQIIPYQSLYF